jgi:TonB family protein
MSRTVTLLTSGIAIFLHHASIAASEAKPRNVEPRTLSEEEAVRLAIFTPAPRYPYEARASHMTGQGLVRVEVDTRTGYVTSARIMKSTGHQILDDEALKAFRAWRFKPGTVSAVRIPVRFTMNFPEYVRAKGHSLWLQNATYWFLPKCPREAREKGLTGKGVAVVKIDPASGYVISAWMLKSTGHQILDSAAILAFRQWRFRSRSITRLEIPIQFTPKGVFY